MYARLNKREITENLMDRLKDGSWLILLAAALALAMA